MKRPIVRWSLALAVFISLVGAAWVSAQDDTATDSGRPYLGVRLDQTTDGVTILEVLPESPAAAAELRAGDLLVSIDGVEVENVRAAIAAIRGLAPGDVTVLGIERDGSALDVEVTLGMTPEDQPGMMPSMPGRGEMPNRQDMPFEFHFQSPINGWLGVSYEPITPELAESESLSLDQGALIREVVAESPAAAAGLQVGDVVTAVNGEPVDEERTLRDRMLAYEPEDTVSLTVLRGDETIDLDVTLGSFMPAFEHGMFGGHMTLPFQPGAGAADGTPATPEPVQPDSANL